MSPSDEMDIPLLADFHQYFLCDSETVPDFSLGDRLTDGVIAPQSTGLQLFTGVQCGTITVSLHAFAPTADATGEVAAECDIFVGSGVIELASPGRKVAAIDWGQPVRLRMRVTMAGRDQAHDEEDGSLERHHLYLWLAETPQPRWRSPYVDRIGTKLA